MSASELRRVYERAARRLGLPYDRSAWTEQERRDVEEEVTAIVEPDEDYGDWEE